MGDRVCQGNGLEIAGWLAVVPNLISRGRIVLRVKQTLEAPSLTMTGPWSKSCESQLLQLSFDWHFARCCSVHAACCWNHEDLGNGDPGIMMCLVWKLLPAFIDTAWECLG